MKLTLLIHHLRNRNICMRVNVPPSATVLLFIDVYLWILSLNINFLQTRSYRVVQALLLW